MVGWLVVNHFLNTPKFHELYAWIERSAQAEGVELVRKTNVELATQLLASDERPDFVMFWDKDVRLAQLLEARGVRCFNNARAIEVCDDKALTYSTLAATDIRQPKTIVVPKAYAAVEWAETGFADKAIVCLGLPLVAKLCFGSFGTQVQLIKSRDELLRFLDEAGTEPAILQEFIAESKGRDARIQVVGGEVVAAMQRTAAEGDFRSNLTNGGSAVPYEPTPEQAAFAIDVCDQLQLDFAGVDIMFGEGGAPILCEVNSNAHFVNLSNVTGIDVGAAIMRYVVRTMR